MAAEISAHFQNRGSHRKTGTSCALVGCCCLALLMTGCSGSESGDKNATAQNAAAPPPVQQPVIEKKQERKAMAKAGKADQKAKSAPAKKEPTSKPVGQWTLEDLKTAIANKDPRYVPAVTMHGANSRRNDQTGGELSQLLAEVAKMPSDGLGVAGANSILGKSSRKKKNGKHDDDDEPAPGQPATPAAGAAPAAAPGTPPVITLPSGGGRLFRKRGEED